MAKCDVTQRVYSRNEFGAFAAAISRAGTATVEEAIKQGADIARHRAPRGHKVDKRTIPLHTSIYHEMVTPTQGIFGTRGARHAAAIELGARPHSIGPAKNLRFWWEAEGRFWRPGLNEVSHPGNRPYLFLDFARRFVAKQITAIARSKYPR